VELLIKLFKFDSTLDGLVELLESHVFIPEGKNAVTLFAEFFDLVFFNILSVLFAHFYLSAVRARYGHTIGNHFFRSSLDKDSNNFLTIFDHLDSD